MKSFLTSSKYLEFRKNLYELNSSRLGQGSRNPDRDVLRGPKIIATMVLPLRSFTERCRVVSMESVKERRGPDERQSNLASSPEPTANDKRGISRAVSAAISSTTSGDRGLNHPSRHPQRTWTRDRVPPRTDTPDAVTSRTHAQVQVGARLPFFLPHTHISSKPLPHPQHPHDPHCAPQENGIPRDPRLGRWHQRLRPCLVPPTLPPPS